MSKTDKVIMCEDKFKQRDLQRKYNRLYDLAEKHREEVIENPFDALDLAMKRVCDVEAQLEEIKRVFACDAMSIGDGVTFEQPQYESIESVLMRRQNQIQEILEGV